MLMEKTDLHDPCAFMKIIDVFKQRKLIIGSNNTLQISLTYQSLSNIIQRKYSACVSVLSERSY